MEYPQSPSPNDEQLAPLIVEGPAERMSSAEPLAAASHEPVAGEPAMVTIISKLAWVAAILLAAALFRWVTPSAIEEIRYSLSRGEQRAKYETAKEFVQHEPLQQISYMYGAVSDIVGPSVVHINTSNARQETREFNDEENLVLPPPEEIQGQGSGVIIDSDGYIITNFHVIRGSTSIQVVIAGRQPMDAQVVGVDPPTDLAVLHVEAEGLIAAEWGDSDTVNVGSLVWAAGSPFGLERTITSGILSAKHRAGKAGTVYQDFLQSDAAVNPGNSGGPLVNSEGQVIGINTAIVGQTYQGISFAIPSNVAKNVFDRIRKEGRVSRGWLGVQHGEVTPDRADALGLPVGQGAYVENVVGDRLGPSPAQKAGIERGDVIIAWNGVPIESPMKLSRQVAQTSVGETVEVIVIRAGQQTPLEVTVGERAPGF